MEGLVSEVELNQDLITEGTVLFYEDMSNTQKWTVTSKEEGYFEAIDIDGHTDIFMFNELQFGWTISDVSKFNLNIS